MVAELRLPVLALPGLSPDSLGNYLASLGLLRVVSRKWPSTRIAWRDEVLQVVGGPPTLDELLDELVQVASKQAWSPYDRRWKEDQKKATNKQSGDPLALWLARAEERELEIFAAHAVPHARVSYNPLLGTGGNAGKRAFSDGWSRAAKVLAKPGKECIRAHLRDLLCGNGVGWLVVKVDNKLLNSGSWFSESGELYNNGQSKPSRVPGLSPWAMVLACEGLALFAGAASRRLGVRAGSAIGAFPFITQPAASENAGEAGRILGEVWTPLWSRLMTLAETRILFSRGRAELRGRGAVTPAAFATAIRKRGVDAGINEFRRFTLGRTTSANTFEPRFEARFSLDADAVGASTAISLTLERVTALIEQRGFPRDRKVGQHWRFEGLRGPIEAALLDVAAEPNRSEAAIALLDVVAAALDRIDRNRSFREGKVRWEPLPLEWLPSLFADEQPGVEARLALSLVSGFPDALPFAAFRFGLEWTRDGKYDWATKPRWFEHSKVVPARWVWGPGELARVLGAVLCRRLFDGGKLDTTNTTRPQGRAPLTARLVDVGRWFAGDLDESLLVVWLSRLALFDWRTIPQEARSLISAETTPPRADGELALLGLVQPFVDQRPLVVRNLSPNDLLSDETGARTTEVTRSLVTLIRSWNLDAAIRLASSRYAMAGVRLASFDVPWCASEPDRLVAALLFTISDRDRAVLFQRWLRPRRRQTGGEAHV
ncbi:MAG: type I-U CRISPR-associated protein Csx17 [Nitrospira sp.]|nr:type I-U CRISPR-associated protein Csx17 [Nitrospira sp.]